MVKISTPVLKQNVVSQAKSPQPGDSAPLPSPSTSQKSVFGGFFCCSQSVVCLHTVFPEQQMYMLRLLRYLPPVALEGHQLWEHL